MESVNTCVGTFQQAGHKCSFPSQLVDKEFRVCAKYTCVYIQHVGLCDTTTYSCWCCIYINMRCDV